MKKIISLAFGFILLFQNNTSFAQTINDGCMRVTFDALWAWNEEYEDPFFDDETNWQWFFADVANVDGNGWIGGQCLAQCCFFQIGWWNHGDYNVGTFNYGTFGINGGIIPTPATFNLRGKFEGNDCGGDCDQNTSCLFDDDDYIYDDAPMSTGINYRSVAPNSDFIFQRFTSWHGSSDFGGEFRSRYSSPRPATASSNPSTICSGVGATSTLSAGGAVFGGIYNWYIGSTFIGSGSTITVSPGVTTTYRVYTSNGGINSLCYNEVTVTVVNCNFNCTTTNIINPGTTYDVSQGINGPVTVPGFFPANSYLVDVNANVNFSRPTGFASESMLELQGLFGGCPGVSLVDPVPASNSFGSGTGSFGVIFDEEIATPAPGFALTSGSTVSLNPLGNLNQACWMNYLNPNGIQFNLRAGDAVAGDNLVINSFSVDVCGCKPPVSASASPATLCVVGSGSFTLTGSGSQSALSANGYGDELRWFLGSCGGTYVGSGLTLTLPVPGTPGTYTYYCNWYYKGKPCGGSVSGNCVSTSITVVPNSISGSISSATPTFLCEGNSTSLFTLTGQTGNIVGWELSNDGGASWSIISGTGGQTTYNPDPAGTFSSGVLPITSRTYSIRVAVQNSPCNITYSNVISWTVVKAPSAGTAIMNNPQICNNDFVTAYLQGSVGSIQWQTSTSSSGPFTNIAGQTTDNLNFPYNNTTSAPVQVFYRAVVSNTPCPNATSNVISITIYPSIDTGTIALLADTVCNGGNPAAIQFSTPPSGGSGNFSYQWYSQTGIVACPSGTSTAGWTSIPGATLQTYDPPAGISQTTTFACLVDAVGTPDCGIPTWASGCRIVTVLPLPQGSIDTSSTICEGDTAILTFHFSDGLSPFNVTYTDGLYTYTKSAVVDGDTIVVSPLVNSSFTLTSITDSRGCTRTSSFTANSVITVNQRPSINLVSSINPSCFGYNNGSITITASGVSLPLQFSIDSGTNFQLPNVFSGLTSGSYNIIVRGNNGCQNSYNLNPLTLLDPTQIDVTLTSIDPSCANTSNGQITGTGSGGTIPYTFSLNGGALQPSSTFNNLGSGTYTLYIYDLNGCVDSAQTIISPAYIVSPQVDSLSNVSCNGANDGSITVSLTNGSNPVTYTLNGLNPNQTGVFTGLSAGTYIVQMTDANGCFADTSLSITEPTAITLSANSTNNLCFGDSTGSIDLTAIGGSGSYTFIWNNGATTEDLINIPSGTYTVTVSESGGCSAIGTWTILQPTQLITSIASFQNVLCNGDSSGYIDITVLGGTIPYNFIWSTGSTSEDIINLPGGTYSVTVLDNNGCESIITQTLNEPSALNTSINATHVTCFNGADGQIDLQVSGGSAPYSFTWSNGAITEDLNTLSAGLYVVTITDNNGCQATNYIAINQPPALLVSETHTNVLCFGDSSATIDISVNSGTSPFSFAWSNGASSEDLTNAPAGSYTVTVTDANGCTVSLTILITQPLQLIGNVASFQNILCASDSSGNVNISFYGGVAPYTFLWSNGATTEDIFNLAGGTYTVTISDINGCSITLSQTLSEPLPLIVSATTTEVSCNGGSNGAIDLNVNGGTAPYSFSWSNGSTTEDLNNLTSGLYVVTVTDDNGCNFILPTSISQPTLLQLNPIVQNISCNGGANGSIDLNPSGGTPIYTFVWSGGETSEDLTNLTPGTYSVTLSDGNNCIVTAAFAISQPAPLFSDLFVTGNSCPGDSSGIVNLVVSGGTPGYTFVWNSGQTTEDLNNLAAGEYTVIITDANNCTLNDTAVVIEPAFLYTSGIVDSISCFGLNDGEINITPYGGTPPYSYSWSNGSSTEDLVGLYAGLYTVVITDNNGCTVNSIYEIVQPAVLQVNVSGTNVLCAGDLNGSVSATVSGGTTPYNYLWNNFSFSSSLSNLSTGTYTVLVEDARGCLANGSYSVTSPVLLTANATASHISCYGLSTGSINVTVNGGVSPYTFNWSGGLASVEDPTNVTAGVYTVTITDNNNCSTTTTVEVTQNSPLLSYVTVVNPGCSGANNGSANVLVQGGVAPYQFQWNGGQTSASLQNLVSGLYIVTVTDAVGCSVVDTADVSAPQLLDVNLVSIGNAKCFNSSNGSVEVSVSGGNAPYQLLLNGVSYPVGNIQGLLPGNYTVLVLDANGCSNSENFEVLSPQLFNVELQSTYEVILSGMPVELNTEVTPSQTILSYNWTPVGSLDFSGCGGTMEGCANPIANPLTTTTYVVTVMNSDSCTVSDTLRIEVSPEQSVFFPTAFTPNGDGLNDRFEFDILGATSIEVNIWNRWGEKVYNNANQQNGVNCQCGWDGTFNNKLCSYDTYVYQLNVSYFDGIERVLKGTITIMR